MIHGKAIDMLTYNHYEIISCNWYVLLVHADARITTPLYITHHFTGHSLTGVSAVITAADAVTFAEAERHHSIAPYRNLTFGAYTTCHSHFGVAVVCAVEKHGT